MIAPLAQLFPLLAVVAVVLVLILALRLDRRLSRGAYSAGPADIERPSPPGQERIPWELKAIDDQLTLASGGGGAAIPRYDLTATVNRLISAAGLPSQDQLPLSADLNQLTAAIGLIEQRLGLPVLPPPMTNEPSGSSRLQLRANDRRAEGLPPR
jgi:hypothetical protein